MIPVSANSYDVRCSSGALLSTPPNKCVGGCDRCSSASIFEIKSIFFGYFDPENIVIDNENK